MNTEWWGIIICGIASSGAYGLGAWSLSVARKTRKHEEQALARQKAAEEELLLIKRRCEAPFFVPMLNSPLKPRGAGGR